MGMAREGGGAGGVVEKWQIRCGGGHGATRHSKALSDSFDISLDEAVWVWGILDPNAERVTAATCRKHDTTNLRVFVRIELLANGGVDEVRPDTARDCLLDRDRVLATIHVFKVLPQGLDFILEEEESRAIGKGLGVDDVGVVPPEFLHHIGSHSSSHKCPSQDKATLGRNSIRALVQTSSGVLEYLDGLERTERLEQLVVLVLLQTDPGILVHIVPRPLRMEKRHWG